MLQFSGDARVYLRLALAGIMLLSAGTCPAPAAEPAAERSGGLAGEPAYLPEVLRAAGRAISKPTPPGDPVLKDFHEAEPRGISTAAARKLAQAAIPLDRLSPENHKTVSQLLKNVSFYRRLPKVTFAIEPEVYNYFVAHPDVAVSIWRAMKISKLQMWQTGRYDYEAETDDGSSGILDVVYAGPEQHLVICDGQYKSPLFSKPIAARSLMLLQTGFSKEPDGTIYCTHRADLWVTFPSQTVDAVSKIFSPLAVTMTDRTFTEISLFLKMMSLAMSRRPDWVEQIAQKMDGIPDLRKEQLRQLTTQVYTTVQKRSIERAAQLEELSSDASGIFGAAEPEVSLPRPAAAAPAQPPVERVVSAEPPSR